MGRPKTEEVRKLAAAMALQDAVAHTKEPAPTREQRGLRIALAQLDDGQLANLERIARYVEDLGIATWTRGAELEGRLLRVLRVASRWTVGFAKQRAGRDQRLVADILQLRDLAKKILGDAEVARKAGGKRDQAYERIAAARLTLLGGGERFNDVARALAEGHPGFPAPSPPLCSSCAALNAAHTHCDVCGVACVHRGVRLHGVPTALQVVVTNEAMEPRVLGWACSLAHLEELDARVRRAERPNG